VIPRMQRLERLARMQLERLYEETRRGASTVVAVDRRAVDRVHELMALTRSGGGGRARRRPSSPARH